MLLGPVRVSSRSEGRYLKAHRGWNRLTGDPEVGMKYQEWELQEDGFVFLLGAVLFSIQC